MGDDPSRRHKISQAKTPPLAPAPPQGCVALHAPVLRSPLLRAGFAVTGASSDGLGHTKNKQPSLLLD
jgi:hypothetical protein